MVNRRLRGAMLEAEVTVSRLAELVDVDVKTVQRWLTDGRTPYPATRYRVAHVLGHEETYLWPAVAIEEHDSGGCFAGVAGSWPMRTAISSDYWHSLFDRAAEQIDILVCAGSFLIETLDFIEVLRFKADSGARIRLAIADPDGVAVRFRANELGLTWLPERCRTMATQLAEAEQPGLCARTHDTTVYASQFRFDDALLVNSHAHGVWAAQSPVWQLDRARSPIFDFYANAFERVWATTGHVDGGQRGAPEGCSAKWAPADIEAGRGKRSQRQQTRYAK